jgi:hypothetical protein
LGDLRLDKTGLAMMTVSSHRSTIGLEQSLFERIREFIHKKTGYPLDQIQRTTRLAREIGLTGREARRFFGAFATEFKVDLESFETLNFRSHFGSESAIFIEGFFAALLTLPGVVAALYFSLAYWIVIVCGFGSFFLIIMLLAAWRKERHGASAIVVQDLVDAGLTRSWRAVK